MRNKVLISIFLVIFIGVLIFASDFMNKDAIEEQGKIEVRESTEEENLSSEYVIEVDESSFQTEVSQSDQKVLIDFYATWCEPCKMLSPIIDEVAKENKDVKFVRIDVDKCAELSTEYGIQYMPTLVLVEGGEEVNRSVGVIDKEAVLKFIGK